MKHFGEGRRFLVGSRRTVLSCLSPGTLPDLRMDGRIELGQGSAKDLEGRSSKHMRSSKHCRQYDASPQEEIAFRSESTGFQSNA